MSKALEATRVVCNQTTKKLQNGNDPSKGIGASRRKILYASPSKLEESGMS